MFVIPQADQKIVDPQRMDPLPAYGRDVGDDHAGYWGRRAAEGSVKIVPDAEVEAARKNAEKAEADEAAAARKAAAESKTPVVAPAAGKQQGQK